MPFLARVEVCRGTYNVNAARKAQKLTCIGVGCQATLVKSLQQEPADSAARPTTKHAGNDVIEAEQGNSASGGQVRQDEAGLLHLGLNRTECRGF